MDNIKEKMDEKIQKTLSILKEELNGVRAGRANPALLDKVTVDYYGTQSPLKNIANISVPDPKSIVITPYEASMVPEIERGINMANIGLTPSNDGKAVRLTMPQMTEDSRIEITKTVKKIGEDSKIAIRNLRRDANEHLKKLEKDGEYTEDDLKDALEEVEDDIKETIEKIDEIVKEKEKEIMEV